VDPDNRRPVDYARRRAMLAELQSLDMDTCVDRGLMKSLVGEGLRDGRCKLFLTWKVLQFRGDHESLFRDGDYVPLRVTGDHASNVCAFARRHASMLSVTIAPRLYLRLLGDRDDPPLGASVWSDTAIELPKEYGETVRLKNVLDGKTVVAGKAGARAVIRAGEALANFPVGLLSAAGAQS
jgi:(1->4)-alpha-D-glucan 1-alpha-D-glucosylmutase